MIHLICFLICGIVIFFGDEKIRKNGLIAYFLALAFCLELCYRMGLRLHGYEVLYPKGLLFLMNFLENGALPTIIFIWVMMAGALPNTWKLRKKIMMCRGEISIVASTLILPHVVYYLMEFLANSSRLSKLTGLGLWGILTGAIAGLVAGVIMVPLFITSYHMIRKQMNGRRWKALQEYAYIFYGLVYIHILAEYFAKAENLRDSKAMLFYTVSFVLYLLLRFFKNWQMKRKKRIVV